MTYTYNVKRHNGNLVIHETEPFIKCTDETYPPTAVRCAKFVMAGVTDNRTITQDHTGPHDRITDMFTSTDGKKHSLDLLWDNNQRFYEARAVTRRKSHMSSRAKARSRRTWWATTSRYRSRRRPRSSST